MNTDLRDLFIFLWTLGILLCLGLVAYALYDLRERSGKNNLEDEIDRELRELIGDDK